MQAMLAWSKEEWDATVEYGPIYWTTRLTDGSKDGPGHVIDISDTGNGENREVTFDEREEYVGKATEVRLTAYVAQC